jgi:glycerol-3-phosphate dehydrogenase
MFRILARRRVLYTTAAGAAAAGGAYYYVTSPQPSPFPPPSGRPPAPWTPATRSEMIRALKKSSLIGKKGDGKVEGPVKGEEYDLLIVGGGATGAGVAVDAASRGLKVALVERDDFSSGEHFRYLLTACPLNLFRIKGPRRNRQNWFMEVFDTSKRQYLSSTTSNGN